MNLLLIILALLVAYLLFSAKNDLEKFDQVQHCNFNEAKPNEECKIAKETCINAHIENVAVQKVIDEKKCNDKVTKPANRDHINDKTSCSLDLDRLIYQNYAEKNACAVFGDVQIDFDGHDINKSNNYELMEAVSEIDDFNY